jgi:hypothetical protein
LLAECGEFAAEDLVELFCGLEDGVGGAAMDFAEV